MKKILFSVMVAAAFAACNNQAATTTEAATEAQEIQGGDIAYVHVEEVLAKSDIYLSEGKALEEKTTAAQQKWAKQQQNLQYEMNQLQEKYQKGLITSFNAQQEQEKLQKRAVNLENTVQTEGAKLEEENFVFSNRAQDLIMRAVQEVNGEKKYKMVVNASALLDADTTLNITPLVLEAANRLYASEKSETKE